MIYAAIDFDGTCVMHEYPRLGADVPDAVRVLKRMVDAGSELILNTMRSGDELQVAVHWFDERGIPLYGTQKNPTQKHWTSSPKCYANLYIDDAGINCPLIHGKHARAYADWNKIEQILIENNILNGVS